jgi:hypothetical protein
MKISQQQLSMHFTHIFHVESHKTCSLADFTCLMHSFILFLFLIHFFRRRLKACVYLYCLSSESDVTLQIVFCKIKLKRKERSLKLELEFFLLWWGGENMCCTYANMRKLFFLDTKYIYECFLMSFYVYTYFWERSENSCIQQITNNSE